MVSRSTPTSPASALQRVDDQLGLVGVVARGHRGVRGEHGARAGRGQRLLSDAPRSSSARASSSEAKAAWPSLRCTTDGSIPIARSARMPPTPSSRYWARRRSRVPVYRRELIQRATAPFSGRSASSRKSGTRPTSTRQICATTCSAPTGTVTVIGSPSSPVTRAIGWRSGIGRHPRLVLPAGGVDALAEVALAVEQADGDQRQRPVGGLLEDVAGQRPEAAGVDRQRGVDAVLGAEEAHRALGGGRRGRLGGPRHVGADALLERPGALTRPSSAAARSSASGGASVSSLIGFSPHSSQRWGSTALKGLGAAGRPRPAQVVGGPRERVQRRGHARGKGLRGAVDVLASGQHGRA